MPWVCDRCGEIEEPVVVEDRREYFGSPCYEKFYQCPNCGESVCYDE